MRAYEEIRNDIQRATELRDVEALRRLADEMQAIAGNKAVITATMTLGTANAMSRDFDVALQNFRHASELATVQGDTSSVCVAALNIGAVYIDIGDHERAIEWLHRAIEISTENDAKRLTNVAYKQIAYVYLIIKDHPLALEYYQRAIGLAEEVGDRSLLLASIIGLGNVYGQTGDLLRALEYHQRAAHLADELGDLFSQAYANGSIGNVHLEAGEYDRALERLHAALETFETFGDVKSTMDTLGNIGMVHKAMGDLDQAMKYFETVLAGCMKEGLKNTAAAVLGSMAEIWIMRGELDKADQLLRQPAAQEVRDPSVRATYHGRRGMLLAALNDLDGAHVEQQAALEIALGSGLRSLAADVHLASRDLAQQRNDFAAYIHHNNEYTRISDEIRGKETTQRLAMMEAERKVEGERREREKERALLYGALPKSVADRMLRGEKVSGDHYDDATVIFADIVGFTQISENLSPGDVVALLERIFSEFDAICEKHGVTKVKTIGDSYMAVAFDTEGSTEHHTIRAARCALAISHSVSHEVSHAVSHAVSHEVSHSVSHSVSHEVAFRIGMHSGPVTAGVIGTQRLQYDVWGDTVNVASRMESAGEPGKVHVSEAFAIQLKANTEYTIQNSISESPNPESHSVSHSVSHPVSHSVSHSVSHEVPLVTRHSSLVTTPRGSVDIKGKGLMNTYWLVEG
ncbi:MAG: tetratricopeptide repeat protein [Bacteroidetes bacterium]|nr:tetratricopeptide repeat protein [Bacteroidota bacterium]